MTTIEYIINQIIILIITTTTTNTIYYYSMLITVSHLVIVSKHSV